MRQSELRFVPLGGVGEFGANLALYGYGLKGDERWIMLDCGLAFADDSQPGVEILVPDPAFIAERRDKLLAIVLTHAHEDHLGAVQYLWPKLRCPVYATPFASAILRGKLEEGGLVGQVPVHVVPIGGSATIGDFTVTYIGVTHSILEAHSIAIRTPAGTVVHTGDWKLDPEPRVGKVTDESALRSLGDSGVLALMGDSTNALSSGHSGSEGALRPTLRGIVAEAKGAVAATLFASNAARIETICDAAAANDRVIVMVGRSLWRTVAAARECGYLRNLPAILDEYEAERIPREHVLYIVTGCQGEPRAALSRIALGEHRNIGLGRGDTVIFSSKVIPGNERPIARIVNRLMRAGVRVVTERDRAVHVSGHPNRDELKQMIAWLRPRVVIPVHGAQPMLEAHAGLARGEGVEALVINDGEIVRFAPGGAEVVDRIKAGRLAVSGSGTVPLEATAIQARRRMMYNGAATVILVLDNDGEPAAPPRVLLRGVDLPEGAEDEMRCIAEERVRDLPRARRRDNEQVDLAVRQALRAELRPFTNQRPAIDVEIVRVPSDSRVAADARARGEGK
jgi:ribonuclease J